MGKRNEADMSHDSPRVTLVVPLHNGADYTRRFLASMSEVTYPDFDIIAVDDGSSDDTARLLRKEYAFKITIIEGDGNLWWTRSVNLGVKYAVESGADYVLTINNDTVVEPDFISRLVECAQEEVDVIVSPKILYIDDPKRVWSAAGRVKWFSGKLFYTVDGDDSDGERYSRRRLVEFVHGMGALVPVAVYGRIGLYDEANYPQYHADVEFSLRAARAGIKNMVEPKSIIYNEVNNSRALDIRKRLALLSPLLDPHSPYNLKLNWRLYSDYAPNIAARYIGLAIKYFRYFFGTLRYLKIAGFNRKED